jgi:hypothetical protein
MKTARQDNRFPGRHSLQYEPRALPLHLPSRSEVWYDVEYVNLETFIILICLVAVPTLFFTESFYLMTLDPLSSLRLRFI